VCVHIGAAIVMSLWTRENLIGAMFTGKKRRADGQAGARAGASVVRTSGKDH
jgi:cytochrome b